MSENTPLFAQLSDDGDGDGDRRSPLAPGLASRLRRARAQTRRFLSSRAKHWIVLTLILLDVAGILTDIFIALITCELHRRDEAWVAPTMYGLTVFSLAMSSVFMVELTMSVFADGTRYFANWFHCLDAFVIVGSFAVDLVQHGLAAEIASLVVVLRLWRFVKIVQEVSVEQAEVMGELRSRIEELERQLGGS
ncbi:hypothetical protein F5X97DRAFT_284044 [Nemania serpens]|nr:hypothetical protein F5X97DRAFT_284044 [Nemania serpens]